MSSNSPLRVSLPAWPLTALVVFSIAMCFSLTVHIQPAKAAVANPVISVALGSEHSAAIRADGSLWMWGSNKYGQLGIDNSAFIDPDDDYGYDEDDENNPVSSLNIPRRVMENVAFVSTWNNSTAVIRKDGSLWTWGNNKNGQLGDGTSKSRFLPKKIMDGVSFVELGNTSAALKADGSLWMWGENEYGQIGDGTHKDRKSPVKVMDDVTSVKKGWVHTAALKTDGSLWTWGYNSCGQLGNGTWNESNEPIRVAGDVTSFSTGGWSTAAVKADGSLWAWGSNTYGMFGDDSLDDSNRPVKLLDNVLFVSFDDTPGVIKTDGSLWTWGRGGTGLAFKLSDVVWYSSGVAIKADGTLWDLVGLFEEDESANGQSKPSMYLSNVSLFSRGGLHNAVLKTDGSLWMWGFNTEGQLGDGTDEDERESPVRTKFKDPSSNARLPKGTIFTKGSLSYTVLRGQRAVSVKAVPYEREALTRVVIPSSVKDSNGYSYKVTAVRNSGFKNCSNLETITLKSSNLPSIGAFAFEGCGKLKTVSINSRNLNFIGYKAFCGTKSLTPLNIDKTTKLAAVRGAFKKAGKNGGKKLSIVVAPSKKAEYGALISTKGGNKILTVKKA